ncbi:uncharacterized protein LOC124257201 [Haliotis rubra]|uniref:uncharacterized protein LOC124257201 n=1 Tax=Haliotis rubra TaxID=36100 RepID=UPI001EE571E4|nr:uncharacterized protein LOC124257201 [Haliotis rubra]
MNEHKYSFQKHVVIHMDVVRMFERKTMPRHPKVQREYGREKRIEMSMKASALRNSGGGVIFCHLSGKNKINKCLGQFDDMFSNSQIFCLGEGEIYSHEIQREWFENTDFLVITVSQCISTRVSTANVNSYTSNHGSLVVASLAEIKTLLFGKRDVGHRRPVVRGLENLQKGVDIRLTHLIPQEHLTINANISESLYSYGLHMFISAFSKNRFGGSFYIGVRDDEIGPIMEGVDITSKDHTAFTEALRHFVRQNLMIIPNIHTHKSYDLTDLVEVTFHPVKEDKSVIEFSVRPVNGSVFRDRGGPSAYKLDEKGGLRRMTCQEWMQKIQPAE